jgi:hypothetical protein
MPTAVDIAVSSRGVWRSRRPWRVSRATLVAAMVAATGLSTSPA